MPYDERFPEEIVPTGDPADMQLLPPMYLDDGLYCGHDGFQVILFTLEGQKVAISPEAAEMVLDYMERVRPHYANERTRLVDRAKDKAKKEQKERDA